MPARLRASRDERSQPVIPTRVLSASLLLGAVLRVPSFLQLQAETDRRGWQRLVRWPQPISDDALGYVLERYRIADWRAVLAGSNRSPHDLRQINTVEKLPVNPQSRIPHYLAECLLVAIDIARQQLFH